MTIESIEIKPEFQKYNIKNPIPLYVADFLETYKDYSLDLGTGTKFHITIDRLYPREKINPILKLAHEDDAKEIAQICEEVYEGTYPYKEIENEEAIKEMIKSPQHQFILFKLKNSKNAGCFRFSLDFDNKKGYMGGFMVRKKYQGRLDVVKAIMGSFIWIWGKYQNKILVWYCENRTAHASSQYITAVCGVHTVAIFPNKDIFFNEIESDVMGVIYAKNALYELRKKAIPSIINEVEEIYNYVDKIYSLGNVSIESHKIELDINKITQLFSSFRREKNQNNFGYTRITYSLASSKSYFSFIHSKHIQNIEKIKYHINDLEELYLFLQELYKYIVAHNIRYCEIFASAYRPDIQQLFYEMGFIPRGYVPCWEYNKNTNEFEDFVVFNYFKGELSNIDLLPEGMRLLKCIKF